jgi:GntR family transcriptional repressor for pyruvate dehydrogenase complex
MTRSEELPTALPVGDALREVASSLGHGRSAHDIVADAIQHLIAVGGLRPGDRLPPERDLAIALGAARITVRQAVKRLAAQGLVSTTRGRAGGTFVVGGSGGRHAAVESLVLFKDTIDRAFEFRQILEPPVARMAAQNATRTDRAALVLLSEQPSRSHADFHELDTKFHLLIAKASGNPALHEAIERQRASFFVLANAVLLPAPYEEFPDFADEHREIAKSIYEHDATGAQAEMDAHLTRAHRQFAHALAEAAAGIDPAAPADGGGAAGPENR